MKKKLSQIPSLTFLIPSYNDRATITQVIQEADTIGKQIARVYEIIVINDNSQDDAGKILNNLSNKYSNLRIIAHTENKGYGASIKELYLAGASEWLFTIPGDYQIGAKELLSLLPHKNDADMIIGRRVNRQDPPERLRQSSIYNKLLRVLFGLRLHDINSVRLLKKSVVSHVTLESDSAFVDAELTIDAIRKGFRVIEVPIAHRKREGSLGGGGSWRVIIPTILDMIRYWI